MTTATENNNTQTQTNNTPTETETPTPTENLQELFADTNVTMKSGRMVADAELIAKGKFVKIRIAANKQYMGADNEIKTNVNYFNALVSSNLQEAFAVAEALKKGDWVYIKGEDNTQSFDTPEGYKQMASTTFAYKVVLKREKQTAVKDVKNQGENEQDSTDKAVTPTGNTPAPQ